jgi:hypothetical protein
VFFTITSFSEARPDKMPISKTNSRIIVTRVPKQEAKKALKKFITKTLRFKITEYCHSKKHKFAG